MGKLFCSALVVALLLLASFNLRAQVYNGDLTLTTQAQIDAFNYTQVTGKLIIQQSAGGNITNLNGLSELQIIGGAFGISFNSNLTTLVGLSSLTNINGSLAIEKNSSLENIDGLSALISVGNLLILDNGNLKNVDGLLGLNSVAGGVNISVSRKLTNLNGLSNLGSVGGNLTIEDNDSLTRFCGLYKLLSGNGLVGTYTESDNKATATAAQIVAAGSCSSGKFGGDIRLITQAEVDAFNYTEVIGELIIERAVGEIITNFNGLSALTSVKGNLRINFHNDLTSFDGLSSLTNVDGSLSFEKNTALVNIDGLSALNSIGSLTISQNPVLKNIDGLTSLTSVGSLQIMFNRDLANLDGLSNLSSIGGRLTIQENGSLTNLNGLSNLGSVGGNLRIENNDTLTRFCGLYKLLSGNGLVGTYTESDNKATATVAQVIAAGNCSSGKFGGDIRLITQAEVDAFNYTEVIGNLTVERTGVTSITNLDGLSALTSVKGNLRINFHTGLTSFDGLSSLTNVDGSLSFEKNTVLVNIDGLSALNSIGSLTISQNPVLKNIDGLTSLTSVGSLQIMFNTDLADLDGLSNLSSIGGRLTIQENESLTNLNGLSNLVSLRGDLRITDNDILSNFCGLYTLFKNNGLNGSYTVSDNAINPTQQQLVTGSNQPPVISDVSSSAVILAPANHKMRDVMINYSSNDDCGIASCSLLVTSNEPVNGTGDGDTDPDWEIIDDHRIKLRAERAANGSGRIYTITITCTDYQGNSTTKTLEVRVAHNITGPHSGNAFKVGSTVAFTGEFWDVLTNKHTAKWLVDGSITAKASVIEPIGNKNGKVTGSYKFTTPGVYKLQMNITDQNGVTTYANTNGDLEAIIVIYDPNGGHTYGGGYYNSPAGALVADPSATGKGSYGFAMNYFKNSTNPKGETQFEFKVGDFEFNALNFDYLVISNSMSQFKGTGKIIGGQSGIGFTMTVVDGQLDGTGVDKIRMKIYHKNNGRVIYDNQPGASDAALPTQAVGQNSIVVISGTNNSTLTKSNSTQSAEMEATNTKAPNGLDVIAYPNPTTNNFSITVQADAKEKFLMQVTDMYGRVIETRNVTANSITRFGDRYRPGTYLVRVTKGKEHKEVKLVKLSD